MAAPSAPSSPVDRAAPVNGDPAYALPEAPEPGYSTAAPHISESLLRLLDELELPARHQPQAEALRRGNRS